GRLRAARAYAAARLEIAGLPPYTTNARRPIMKCTLIAIGLLATTSFALRHSLVEVCTSWTPRGILSISAACPHRDDLAHMCRDSKADYQFARYSQNLRILVLHFEHFRCGDARAICTQAGCLHQVYTSTGGRYRLLRHYYAPEGD